jgi:hypothetical protein
MIMFKRIPTFYILLAALLITSAVPLGLMALNTLRATETEVEREQITQLVARVRRTLRPLTNNCEALRTRPSWRRPGRFLLLDPQPR